jgi:hypothetical protein
MQAYSPEVETQMQRFYSSLSEKDRRRYAAVEALKLGWGGKTYISELLGCDDEAMHRGSQELNDDQALAHRKIRQPGGGRKRKVDTLNELDAQFLGILESHTAGSPMDESIK